MSRPPHRSAFRPCRYCGRVHPVSGGCSPLDVLEEPYVVCRCCDEPLTPDDATCPSCATRRA